MPIKLICDVCGVETKRNYVTERLKTLLEVEGVTVACEVMIAIDHTWNGGILCEKCLHEALNSEKV